MTEDVVTEGTRLRDPSFGGHGWCALVVLCAMAILLTMVGTPGHAVEGAVEECEGAEGDDCAVERLRARPFVTVAVVDTGINPYHKEFRIDPNDDLARVHPSEFIDGYPTDASSLDLTLDSSTYTQALQADEDVWSSVAEERLYHVPGTKIIGAYYVPRHGFGEPRILDKLGHGTAVGSVVAGSTLGSGPDPEVLIVVVEGFGTAPYEWATSQPWIDVVTNSWEFPHGSTTRVDDLSRAAVESGKVVTFAAGNGMFSSGANQCDAALTSTSSTAGPSSVMAVGAVSPRNGQSYCWQGAPVDVASYGNHWPAAHNRSTDREIQFGGTSNATPIVAGVVASVILEGRRALGDPGPGPRADGVLAVAAPGVQLPDEGPLADGRLTNGEVREVVEKTAYTVEYNPEYCVNDPGECTITVPTTPAYFATQGYGIVDERSKAHALDVLLGHEPMPDRSTVDQWMAVKNAVADALYE